MSGVTLVLLAKAPEPGRVKTRLCPPATAAQAADLAAAALLDSLDVVTAVGAAPPVVALTGALQHAARAGELARALRRTAVVAQSGNGLGGRIAAAHAAAARIRPGATFQLGMDTPQIDAALLRDGTDRLLSPRVDAVLGPAVDGGWWVLGLRDPRHAGLIADVPTSRGDTGERTCAVLRAAGLRVELLTELTDVDTAADAVLVARQAPTTRFAAAVAALPAFGWAAR